MTTKEALHRLIEDLPDPELVALERFAEFLHTRAVAADPLLRLLADAPVDDEPLTGEDLEALVATERASAEGRISQQELRRELGL